MPDNKIWLLRARRVVFNQRVMSMAHPLTTTAFDLPGFRITKSFGVVRGIMVRSRSVIGNFGAQIQSIFGGNISIYTNLCERARAAIVNRKSSIIHFPRNDSETSSAVKVRKS